MLIGIGGHRSTCACWPGGRSATIRPLGRLLVVELFGLLLSPISWTHHWVWLMPLMIWLFHGPLRATVVARDARLDLAGADSRRGAVAGPELRATERSGQIQPTVVSGLGAA